MNVRSILLVDTDADIRALYRRSFESAGCTVIEAVDGRDALAKALGNEPELVVTEIRLPFIDGIALCELLRSDPATSDVPLLVVTDDTRPGSEQRVQRAGADAVLAKPALPDMVVATAKSLVSQSRESRAHAAALRMAAADAARSAELLAHVDVKRRTSQSKSHARFNTLTPPAAPPTLSCPSCDRPLIYDHSHVGGVNDRHAEQWDYYECPRCGAFQYRQRTRKLRAVS
jgi:CheY-like chemotaxis protein